MGIRPLNCVDSFSSNFKSHCDSGPPGKGLYDPCRFPTHGARICAPVLLVSLLYLSHKDVLFKEMLSLGWVCENGSLDLPESSFSTL
jgi:hypothetical protein